MLELALATGATLLNSAAHAAAALTAVSISAPLILPALTGPSHVEASLAHSGGVEIRSTPIGANSRWTSHCRGSFTAVRSSPAGAPKLLQM